MKWKARIEKSGKNVVVFHIYRRRVKGGRYRLVERREVSMSTLGDFRNAILKLAERTGGSTFRKSFPHAERWVAKEFGISEQPHGSLKAGLQAVFVRIALALTIAQLFFSDSVVAVGIAAAFLAPATLEFVKPRSVHIGAWTYYV